MNYPYHAYALAEEAFNGVKDRGGDPYFTHCQIVADNASEFADGDFTTIKQEQDILYCIGMLHDLLEDAPEFTPRLKLFPSRVRKAVRVLTHKEEESYGDYIDRVKLNPDAVKVKLCDLEHNMMVFRLPELTDADISRLKKYHRAYNELKALL